MINQLVVFEIEGQEFGLDVKTVNGILQAKKFPIKKVPNTPPVIEGVINLRGQVNYIYNLRKKLNFPERPVDDETKVIMIYAGEVLVGVLVDEVTDIVKIPDEDIDETPDFITGGEDKYITGIGKLDGRLIEILDSHKLLTRDEQQRLASKLDGEVS